MSKRKLLVIIPNLGKGGAQKVFHQQVKHLSAYFEVNGCVFNWDGSFEKDRLKNTFSLDVPASISWLHKIYYFFVRIIRLRQLKKELKIDVSISHLEGADYVNLLSRRSDKIICWIHGSKVHDGNINGIIGLVRRRILMPFIYRRADKIVTVSNGIQNELEMSFEGLKSKLTTIYNGFDIDSIKMQIKEAAEPEFVRMAGDSKIFVTHARLSIQKNLSALIHVFANVRKKLSSKLVLIGEGELSEMLIGQSRGLGLRTWSYNENSLWDDAYDVYFLGQKTNPFKYLKHASLYIMTSSWEGFPLALCEALVCNLPVISADCFTGPREILAPEMVLLQPVDAPYYGKFGVLMPLVERNEVVLIKTWADTVHSMMINEELMRNYSEIGIDRIQNFSEKSAINNTIEIIRALR